MTEIRKGIEHVRKTLVNQDIPSPELVDQESSILSLLDENKEFEAAEAISRSQIISSEEKSRWAERLVSKGKYEAARWLFSLANDMPGNSVAGSIVQELIDHGKIETVIKYIEKFREGEVLEQVAIGLMKGHKKGVYTVVHHWNIFSGLSQSMVDALLTEDRGLLRVIAYNLRQFQGLNKETEERLRTGGFDKEVTANPNSFIY